MNAFLYKFDKSKQALEKLPLQAPAIPGREAEFRGTVDKALDYALALGTPRLHAMAGLIPAGADKSASHRSFVENLRFAARELAKHGRTLLIEPLNPTDMPGYFLSSQAQAHAIREEVGEPNLVNSTDSDERLTEARVR